MIKHLFLLVFLFPIMLHAQIEPKYDVGKVPMENGKVVFSRDVTLPGQTQEQIYEAALKWPMRPLYQARNFIVEFYLQTKPKARSLVWDNNIWFFPTKLLL